MIATEDAIRSDIQLYAGGITTADIDYQDRKHDVLRPITQDRRSLPMGYEVHDRQQESRSSAERPPALETFRVDGEAV